MAAISDTLLSGFFWAAFLEFFFSKNLFYTLLDVTFKSVKTYWKHFYQLPLNFSMAVRNRKLVAPVWKKVEPPPLSALEVLLSNGQPDRLFETRQGSEKIS